MLKFQPNALALAAETRRREMPASIALVILTGGVAAAILHGSGPVGWAAIMSLLVVFDTELYRRLDAAETKIQGRLQLGLALWAFFSSAFYVTLPMALWLNGAPAGAAAAMVLWVVGVVRCFGAGASGALPVALAGATAPALALIGAPLAMAATTTRPDWDLAVIAAIGGGALMAYVTQARVSAAYADRSLRDAAAMTNDCQALAALMFEQGPLAAALIDPNGRVLAMSPAMAAGLGVSAPEGRIFEELIPWWPAERWRAAMARALAGETVRYEEDEAQTVNGPAWYSWEVRAWRDSNGDVRGIFARGSDATALVRLRTAREEADAANVSKSQFLASMSHELRTPLNAIIGYSEILMEEAEADGRSSDINDINRVLGSARQLLHLINEILDLSKIEAGRAEVIAADFDVAALLEDAVASVRPSAEKNGNSLQFSIDGEAGIAFTDAFKLNQCILNILANATKFTRDGTIQVSARRVGPDRDWLEIAVSDTGIGMSAAQLDRVFNPFVQAETTTASRFGGAGLGLVITRQTIHLLGGEIFVTSELGKGTVFTLRLPAQAPGHSAPARVDVTAAAGQGAQRLVLVIDDEESARDLAVRSLARLSFVARAAATGREGLALARALKPSLIVLDINLPDLGGWLVLEALRASPETQSIPVIVHSVNDDRKRALALGACAHLVKPADRDVLAAAALRFAVAPEGVAASVNLNIAKIA